MHASAHGNTSRRALRVATVQMACELGALGGNLELASSFVEDAARQGAELVRLPELSPAATR